jgi:hypothetical protein
MTMSNRKVDTHNFYGTYRGHSVRHLKQLLPVLRESSDRLIWTAGDSSLDNKYWFNDTADAPGAYKEVLEPPRSKQDVTYWMNYLCENGDNISPRRKTATINTAVEATTLNERTFRLRPQDIFIRDNIKPEDILIVSIGGNDVALMPCPCTVLAMCGMLALPGVCIEKGFSYGSIPIDDCCCGCGPAFCSCACACPPCLGYFQHLYGVRVQKYVERLTSKTKPSKILVCMIYYLDETPEPGWAGAPLAAMGYNRNPAKLQSFIRKAFYEATSRIQIPGSQVIPVPLFHVLDGKNTDDYVQRVEPSPSGGRKMAEYLLVRARSRSLSPSLRSCLPTNLRSLFWFHRT